MTDNYLRDFCQRFAHDEREKLRLRKIIDKDIIDKKYWTFIPSNTVYMSYLNIVLKKERIKKTDSIIDAGCGVSPILLYLYFKRFTNLKGIDFNEKFINYLHNIDYINSHTELNIDFKVDDILKYNYQPHKIIYSYMPISDEKLYLKYIKRVFSTMSIGSIFMDFYGDYCLYDKIILPSNIKRYRLTRQKYTSYYKKIK